MSRILLLCLFSLFLCMGAKAQYAKSGDLKITEIMYNPPESPDTFEYFEIYNTTNSSISLAGYTLSAVVYTIPKGVSVAAKGRILFCKDSIRLDALTNHTVHGWQWTSGGLNNSGEAVGISDPKGKIVDTVLYSSSKPWPSKANGNGSSLVLCDESKSEHGPANWSAATNYIALVNGIAMRGSPGYGCNGSGAADTNPPVVVYVHTTSDHKVKIAFSEPVSISSDTMRYYNGNLVKHADSLKRSSSFDTISIYLGKSLKDGNSYTITIDSVRDSAGNMMKPFTYTFVFNGRKSGIKITEFMYNNPGSKNLEFIELYNYTTDTIPLGGLNFTKGISYILPQKLLQPGHYFLIARDSLAFDSFYFKISKMHAYQWDKGSKLSNTGGSIHLKNTTGDFMDTFFYDIISPWPSSANGGGSSVVLCNGMADNSIPTNWSQSYDYVDTLAGLKVYASPGKKCGSASNPVRLITKTGRSFCNGPFKIDAGNAGSIFRWNNDSASTTQSILATKPGKYVVIIVNGAGGIVDSVTFNPFIVSAKISDTICTKTKVQFFDNSNVPDSAKRIWYLGDTTSTVQNPFVRYDSIGARQIMLKISDKWCSDSVSKTVYAQLCTGVENISETPAVLKVYPNPSSGVFDLYFVSGKSGESNVKIMDAYGRVVYSSMINGISGASQRIDLQKFSKGMYFLNVTSEAGIITEKLVIY